MIKILAIRRTIGNLLSLFSPGYGQCYRCHVPWNIREGHITDYSHARGCFPLCEWCWKQLTPEERLPFYEQLISKWKSTSHKPISEERRKDYIAIRKAVRAGN